MTAEGRGPQPGSKASVQLRPLVFECLDRPVHRNWTGGSDPVTLIPILIPAPVRPGVIPSIRAEGVQ